MRLNYRGQAYDAPSHSVSGVEIGLHGCFRGIHYPLMQTRSDRLCYPVENHHSASPLIYQFRGVIYFKDS